MCTSDACASSILKMEVELRECLAELRPITPNLDIGDQTNHHTRALT